MSVTAGTTTSWMPVPSSRHESARSAPLRGPPSHAAAIAMVSPPAWRTASTNSSTLMCSASGSCTPTTLKPAQGARSMCLRSAAAARGSDDDGAIDRVALRHITVQRLANGIALQQGERDQQREGDGDVPRERLPCRTKTANAKPP